MLFAIVAILCGLLLLSNYFPKIASALKPIEGIVGLVALAIGIVGVLGGFTLVNVTLILAGIILAVSLIPSLGKMASSLAPLRTVLGVIALVVGVINLFF